jgi:hypothetical protein
MPSNNLDFHGLLGFIVGMEDSPQLSRYKLIPAMKEAGANIGSMDEQVWSLTGTCTAANGDVIKFQHPLISVRGSRD